MSNDHPSHHLTDAPNPAAQPNHRSAATQPAPTGVVLAAATAAPETRSLRTATGATWASARLGEQIQRNGRALHEELRAAEQAAGPGRHPLADLQAEP